MAFRLLKCLARAIARHGGKFVCQLVPGVEALYEIAADAYQDYRQEEQTDDLRAELQALAQAPPPAVGRAVADAVRQEAGQLPVPVQQKLAAYLSQVPAMVRRSLRRPSDPSGTTIPATLALRGPEDLLPFLPPRMPRFSCGDRPLPGVDWILEEPLGVGGFGEVWKAQHAHLRSKAPVALKFCLDAAAVPVFRNEARAKRTIRSVSCAPDPGSLKPGGGGCRTGEASAGWQRLTIRSLPGFRNCSLGRCSACG